MDPVLPFFTPTIQPIDPHLTADETPRLSAQCAAILARLERGPATNRELASVALNYRARVSDCRAAGYDIRVVKRDYKTGYVLYALHAN